MSTAHQRALTYAPTGAQVRRILNECYDIMGAGSAFWPLWEDGAVSTLYGMAPTQLTSQDDVAARTISSEWTPRALRADVLFTYHNVASTNNHFSAGDDAAYSFGDGSDDSAFSLGLWIAPEDITSVALIAKYGSTANLEEYAFRIDSSSNLELELHDASASASEIGTGADTLALYKWQFVVVTYDGTNTAPAVNFYLDGVHDGGDGSTTETGSYVAMEDTATPLLICGQDVQATVAQEFPGWIALPFVAASELTSTEVSDLYELTRVLVGV